jgi:hypothetical protein
MTLRLHKTLPLLIALAALTHACGSEPAAAGSTDQPDTLAPTDALNNSDGTEDIDGFDADLALPPEDARADVDNDLDGSADTVDAAVDADAGPTFCTTDEDCPEGDCFLPAQSPDRGVCTTACSDDSNCAEGWRCVLDQSAGGDAVRICIPVDLCIDEDDDGAGFGPACSGVDCNDDDPLVFPAATELCDGVDNDCDGDIDDNPADENDDCSTSFQGVCEPGRTRCIGGALECVQNASPTEESCDGIDNDCDGLTDEDVDSNPLARSCFPLDPTLLGVGQCAAGTETCAGGRFGACEGLTLPGSEACDGLDNDCDGNIDEDNPGAGVACSTGLGGVCATALTVCQDGQLLCPPITEGRIEVCDGVDNDCDGDIDENNPGGGGSCGTGFLGTCSAGVRTCVAGSLVCEPVTVSATEVCDGLDNDCDGTADENNPGGGGDCTTGANGVCAAGRLVCAAESLQCQSITGPSTDVCDGLDNDCDGDVDEGNPGSGLACPTGQPGICATGVTTCSEGAIACTQTTFPSTEVCNGIDEDCDGAPDNGNPGGGATCGTGRPGICAAGVTSCEAGALLCNQSALPSDDLCDGLDNDCDGTIDENNPGGGVACTTGLAGVCGPGVSACQNGAVACVAIASPTTDICDGLDNDCDGDADEGNPGGGFACTTGRSGICSAGTTECNGGGVVCNQTQPARTETCNGLDDDCNGDIDQGNPDGGASCNTGVPGLCGAGSLTCQGGSLTCRQTTFPSTESCDGFDNNCNGSTDEGNPGGGGACNTGEPGVCSAGTFACQSGGIVCARNQGPTSEVCNGLNDDCDSRNDELCPSSWSAGSTSSSPQWADNDGGVGFTSGCAAGSWAVGFYGRADARIDRFGLVCAAATTVSSTASIPWTYSISRGSSTLADAFGGNGGDPFTALCPDGSFLIGMRTRADDRMDALTGLCGTFTYTGAPGSYTLTRLFTGTTLTAGGTSGIAFGDWSCPGNGVITSSFGRFGAEVDNAQFTCTLINTTTIAP